MQLSRRARSLIASLAVVLCGAGEAAASPRSVQGAALPTGDDFEELRELERQVRRVSADGIAATVHVMVVGRGSMSQGSGVVVDARGTVLTAAHVIGRSGQRCTLTFGDGEQVRGRTLGLNLELDCGMIEIIGVDEDREFPFVALGDERELEYGDWCVALGHPGGLIEGREPVVRLGRLQPAGWMRPFIRTDCAIIQGDSGGPLLDLEGKLIGIHSRIQAGVSSNFHVPASIYQEHWQRMKSRSAETGEFRLRTARMGVRGEDSAPGVRLTEVLAGTAADAAGLEQGDVILQFAERPLRDWNDLVTEIRSRRPGDEIQLLVQRDRERLKVDITLGAHEG